MARTPRSAAVYESIKRRILSREFPRQYALVEESLAEELHVSRTPVREALRRLVTEKLVDFIPYHGAFVRGISEADIEEIFTIREALEGICARIAAERISTQAIVALEKALHGAEQQLEQGEIELSSHTGNALHDVILRTASNERLTAIVADFSKQTETLKQLAALLPGRLRQSNAEHRQVFEALRRGDARESEFRMREHLISTKTDLIRSFRDSRQ